MTGLTHDEILVGLRNLGVDTNCPACIGEFFAGSTTAGHTCRAESPPEARPDPEAAVAVWAMFAERTATGTYDMRRRITASVSKADLLAFMRQIDGTMGSRFFSEAVVVGFDAEQVGTRAKAAITYPFATALDLWGSP